MWLQHGRGEKMNILSSMEFYPVEMNLKLILRYHAKLTSVSSSQIEILFQFSIACTFLSSCKNESLEFYEMGNCIINSLPSFSFVSTFISPPWAFTIS